MPRRPGGLAPEKVEEAWAALVGAGSADDIRAAVQRLPALSKPIMHAYLRQAHLGYRNAHDPDLEHFEARYDALFEVLHENHLLRLVDDARRGEPVEERTSEPDSAGPTALVQLLVALGDNLPADEGPTFDPVADLDAIAREASAACGQAVVLPPYEPPPASRWLVAIVGCARCDQRYLALRAWWADLTQSTALAPDVQEARLNRHSCPRCRSTLCYPQRLWICDSPGPGDLVAALSSVWRFSPSMQVYQPPAGTWRVPDADRLLEIRFDALLRRAPFDELDEADGQGEDAPGITSMAVAYTVAELADLFAASQRGAYVPGLPIQMTVFVDEVARKIREGLLPFHQAEATIFDLVSQVGGDWPLVVPPRTQEVPADACAHLVHLLVAGVVARAQGLPLDHVAMLEAYAASGYLSLGEAALAEATIARAEDTLAQAADPIPEAGMVLREAKADVYMHTNRYAEAAVIRDELAAWVDRNQDQSWSARLVRLRMETNAIAGAVSDGLAEALGRYPALIARWEAMLAEVEASGEPEVVQSRDGVLLSYSGELANYGAAVTNAGHWTKAIELTDENSPDYVKDDRARYSALATLPIPLAEVAEVLPGVLVAASALAEEPSSQKLYELARSLLEQALRISTEVKGWEFAGIQAHRLVSLCSELGDDEAAERHAREAIDHAGRVGDHLRAGGAHAWLAAFNLERGAIGEALRQFDAAALQTVHQLVGIGFGETDANLGGLFKLGGGLLSAGADPAHVASTVESLRAIRTANSAQARMPRGGVPAAPVAAMRHEREQVRIELSETPDDDGLRTRLRQIEMRLDEIEQGVGVRDTRFRQWVDATDLALATPEDLRRHLALLGPRTTWLTVMRSGASVRSVAVWAGGASLGDWRPAAPAGPGPWGAAQLDEMAAAVLEPHAVLATLRPSDTLVVSLPDDVVGVPVAALPYDGRPLCVQVALVCVHGFGLFDASSEMPARPMEALLLVGAPERPERERLAGALAEVHGVAQDLTNSGRRVLTITGPAATATQVISHAAAHDVVHVSCHAERDEVSGQYALLLAADAETGDSGWLTEDRVLDELLLAPGALVDLAGCRTGDVIESTGPVLGGLVPKLLVAGARCVVASLWPIGDDATVALQRQLYRNLAAGQSPAQALAGAQRDAWAGRLGPSLTRTANWAAFVVYGSG